MHQCASTHTLKQIIMPRTTVIHVSQGLMGPHHISQMQPYDNGLMVDGDMSHALPTGIYVSLNCMFTKWQHAFHSGVHTCTTSLPLHACSVFEQQHAGKSCQISNAMHVRHSFVDSQRALHACGAVFRARLLVSRQRMKFMSRVCQEFHLMMLYTRLYLACIQVCCSTSVHAAAGWCACGYMNAVLLSSMHPPSYDHMVCMA